MQLAVISTVSRGSARDAKRIGRPEGQYFLSIISQRECRYLPLLGLIGGVAAPINLGLTLLCAQRCFFAEAAESLSSHSTRDKTLRVAGYGLLLLSGSPGLSREKREALCDISGKISGTRAILRLMDDIPMLRYSLTYGLGSKVRKLLFENFRGKEFEYSDWWCHCRYDGRLAKHMHCSRRNHQNTTRPQI